MRFTHTGRAIKKQGVIYLTGHLCDGNGGAVGKPVGRANHKAVKSKLGVKVHGVGLSPGAVYRQLRITEDQHLGIGIKNFLQGILNEIGTATANNIGAELRGRIDDQLFFIESKL